MPSFIFIHKTVWPQDTNATDRRADRQDNGTCDSIGRTVSQTVAQERFALCCRTVVLSCLSFLFVCDVGVLWPNGWMDQGATWYRTHIMLDGDPPPTQRRGHSSHNFWPKCVVAKWLVGSKCHFGSFSEVAISPGHIVLW